MSGDKEKPTFGPRTLNLSERFHDRAGKLGAPLVQLIASSEYPYYVQLKWRCQKQLDPDDITQWVGFGGDPWVNSLSHPWRRLPRNYRQAGIIATYSWALRDAKPTDQEAHQAVAFAADDIVRVAELPEGVDFTDLSEQDQGGRSLVGMGLRIGGGLLRATMGWSAADGQFITPYQVFAMQPMPAQIDNLDVEYPGLLLG